MLDPFVLSGVRGVTALDGRGSGASAMTAMMRRSVAVRVTRLRSVCKYFCWLYDRNIWLWTKVMPVNPDAKLNQQRCNKLEALWLAKDLVAFDKYMATHRQKTVVGWGVGYRNKVLEHIRYNEGIVKAASRSVQRMEGEIQQRRRDIADEERKIRRSEDVIEDLNETLALLPPKRVVVRKKAKLNDVVVVVVEDEAEDDE